MRAVISLLLILSSFASAQVTGRLTGSVVDPTGASVPKATVSLMLQGGKRPVLSTLTGSDGLFAIETIRPELYDLVVESSGFQAFRLQNVKIDPARSTDLAPIKLVIATTAAAIEVKASAETVQTTSTDISTTVTMDQIRKLPVSDRDVLGFITTQAGVGNSQFDTSINGQRSSFSNVTLDGVNIQDNYIRTGGLSYSPNQLFLDQVQEFTITTSNSASSASGGSQVILSTPSGTNEFHGSAYWQNRINTFAANSFFGNQDGNPLPRLILNNAGVSVGGPVKRDKLFYYVNYEAARLRTQDSVNATILTPDARNGIFTYRDTRGVIQKSRNVLGIVGLQADPIMLALLNQIPGPDKINNFRVGDSHPGQLMNTAGYSFLARSNRDRDNVTGKVDYNLSTRNAVAATFAWNRDTVDRPDIAIGYTATPPVTNDDARKFLAMSWRSSPTAALTNEVRGGFNLAPATFSTSEKLPSYIIGGTIFSSPVAGFLPQGRNTRTYSLQDNASWVRGRHTFQFGYQYQAVRVKSYDYAGTVPTYNVGISSANQADFLLGSADLPRISATDLDNANLLLATLGGLLDNANITYNVNNRTSGFVSGAPYQRNLTFDNHSFYGQDQWRIRKNLTVTLGLRWDYLAPVNENDSLLLQPQLVNNDPRATLLSNATLNFAGNSVGRPIYNKDLNNFGPNVGIAWDVFGNGKTSVRAGYSIQYVNDEQITVTEAFANTNAGLQGLVALNDLSGTISTKPALTAPKFQVPLTFADDYANDPFAYFGLVDPHLRTPYNQEFNFSIQQDIKGTIIEARYIGSHATKLLRGFDYNQTIIRQNGFLADFQRAQSNGNLARTASGTFNPAYNSRIPGSQPLTIFPQLASGGFLSNSFVRSLIDQGEVAELAYVYQAQGLNGPVDFFPNPNALSSLLVTNFSNSRYDSLQLEVRRRFSQGLAFQANYVFSKWLSDAAGVDQLRFEPLLDINNAQIERSRTPTDLTHQFKANYAYDLPFGEGHRIQRRGFNRLLSGWTTSGNLTWQSGNPFSVYSGRGTFLREDFSGTNEANTLLTKTDLNSLFQFRMTPNGPYFVQPSVIGADGRAVNQDGQPLFAGQVFTNPAAGNVGTLQKRMFTGPSVFDMDAALIKDTKFNERYSVELRMEALNVFNHPSFAIFSQNINSQQFGQITSTAFAPRQMQFALRFKF